jgi:predicted DsbA family dithiol-disulfide isomerase
MHKYGISREQSQQNRQNIVERGLDAGFRFNLSDDSLSFNTFNLHRLLFWAKAFNKQTELKIAFFYAHFAEGKQLNQKEDLLTVIKSVGLNTEEAEQVLSSNEFETEVRAEQNHMHQMGVNSVPSFIINQKYLISGGQPSEAFKQALTQINSEQPA